MGTVVVAVVEVYRCTILVIVVLVASVAGCLRPIRR